MNRSLKVALSLAAAAFASPAFAQITFFEHDGYQGRSFTATKQVKDFSRMGFNDRASSVEVKRDRWEVCQDARFGGHCMVLRPGRYPSLAAMGLNDRISSVRQVATSARYDEGRYAPQPYAAYDARRRGNEKIYQANVTSVRAVMGPSEQHCWIERGQVDQDRFQANVPGGISAGVTGGILGHQVGSGRQDVQRCSNAPSQANPAYWDVTYNFKGRDHRVQMAAPPGHTVSVNSQGEPRA